MHLHEHICYLESDTELPEAVIIGTIDKPEFDYRILFGLGVILAIIYFLNAKGWPINYFYK